MKTRIFISLFTMLCGQIPLAQLTAQGVVFNTRNGANTAYCGPIGSGPLVLNRFSLPEPTHDVISVSEPGATNWPQSSAESQLDVMASASGITISGAGSAQRGVLRPFVDFGASAVAAATDSWEFTLAAPARFTFNARWNSSATAASGIGGGFAFGGIGLRPDPGTVLDTFSGVFSTSRAFERQGRGRLLAGRYVFSMNFRVDGVNTYPFSGSFTGTMALEFGPDAPAIVRTQILPQGLEFEWTDLGAKLYTVETSSSFLGDNWTPVSGMTWPVSNAVVVLPAPTTFPAFYRVKMH